MRNAFRDFFRRIRVGRHVARHGHVFRYHGLDVVIPKDAGLSAMNALLRGKYEREEAHFISRYLPGHLPVVELGGSLGVVSRLIASRLDAGVQHIIVEANADLMPILARNAGSGGSEPMIEQAAIGYGASSIRFRLGKDVHSNAVDDGSGTGTLREVRTVTLAALLERLSRPRSYSLVCDIEGAEYDLFEQEADALRGAELAIVETHPASYRTRGRNVEDFLKLAHGAGLETVEQQADVIVFKRSPRS